MNTALLKKIGLVLITVAVMFIAFSSVALAVEPNRNYTPLALPQSGDITIRANNPATLIIDIFRYTIAASAALAIVMIIIGGIQYMSTDAWSGKKDGKERIKQALVGLLLVMLTFLILQTINPKIVDISFLNKSFGPGTGNTGITPPVTTQWCAAIFRNDTMESFNAFTGFDCTKTTEADCENFTKPYYTSGPGSRWCVALFRNDSLTTYGEFAGFDCSKTSAAQCNTLTKPYYIADNSVEGRWCVAVFNANGTFNQFDCAARSQQDCTAKPNYWRDRGFTTSGTLSYSGGGSHQFTGCFQKFAVTGTINYSTGPAEVGEGGACFPKYTTSGMIPGRQSISSCVTEETASQLQYN
jgi:hypothetical protein